MARKKNNLFLPMLAIIFMIFSFLGAKTADAYDVGGFTIPGDISNLNKVFTDIAQPISTFAQSAKQISTNFSREADIDLNILNVINPKQWFDYLDSWFRGVTGGYSLSQILKPIGNALIWILMFLADVIRRGLSYL